MRGVRGDHAALGGDQDGGDGHGAEDREQFRLEVGHPDVRPGDAEELQFAAAPPPAVACSGDPGLPELASVTGTVIVTTYRSAQEKSMCGP